MKKENKVPKPEELLIPNIHLIVFKLGKEEYGIRIEQVKEVTITPEITKMPKTPEFIKGVANIRGDIIAVMDLEERFKIRFTSVDPENLENEKRYTLVIEVENFTMGIVVREVPQSLSLPFSQIDKAPNIIKELNINDSFIDGIAKIDGRLIIVLNIEKILTSTEVQELEGIGD